MLISNLEKIIKKSKERGLSLEYIKTELKEELIYYALDFIYNSPRWNKLIFGGGTALKIIGKTARLSEDLDMDYLEGKFDSENFVVELLAYFKNIGIDGIVCTSKQNGKIITLKFPILKKLRIIKNTKSESDFLYLKIEVEKNQYSKYNIVATPISRDNLFFVVKNYSLETLFSNKIGAIMGRKDKVFQDKFDFKGRDFYDLVWFLAKKIEPDLARLKQIIKKEQNIVIKNNQDIWKMLRTRIENIDTKGIYMDMKNLVESAESVKQLANNYLDIYNGYISVL